MKIFSLVLLLSSVAFLVYVIVSDIKKFGKGNRPKELYPYEFPLLLIAIPILLIAAYILSGIELRGGNVNHSSALLIYSILIAFIISFFWFIYLNWLDIYERENKAYIFLTFVMGCLATFLVFPISGYINKLGFVLNGDPNNDFLYSFIGIGLVEEFVKLLPFLIMLAFSKQINEPFDFILYASVSALGFAFVENVMYLQRTELTAVYARALYSSVAHMFFSSVIAYGLIRIKIVKGKFNTLQLLGLLLLAALGHGFYDFWLISSIRIQWITTLFFMITIHMWAIMKNNLVNLSNFYDPALKLNSHLFLYRLINLMLITLVVAIVGFNVLRGADASRQLLTNLSIYYAYMLLYITISFSSYRVIPGFVDNIWFPVDRMIKNAYTIVFPKLILSANVYEKKFKVDGKILVNRGVDHKWADLLKNRKLTFVKRAAIEYDSSWFVYFFGDQKLLLKPVSSDSKRGYSYKLHIMIVKEEVEEDKQAFSADEVQKLALAYGDLTDI